jgi:hypothetical protein
MSDHQDDVHPPNEPERCVVCGDRIRDHHDVEKGAHEGCYERAMERDHPAPAIAPPATEGPAVTRIEDVGASASITDGRVSMSVEDGADLYLKTRDREPLSVRECHATLEIVGDGFAASVALDGEDLDALADALYHAQVSGGPDG